MKPANDLMLVKSLASDESNCILFTPVTDELRRRKLDSEDLLAVIETEIGESHCFKSKATEKYYPATTSDYFSIWIEECECRMFIKLLVATQSGVQRLVVTSFKKDTNHDV